MARPLRLEFPGAIYHITSRGNARGDIFFDEQDREVFLSLLTDTVERYNWLCHAYCLMDNHYHLLVETLDPTLSLGMRQLNGVYTQKFNRRHQRVGHIFQGRYKSILVEKSPHLLELCRYIVLNPVRAEIVTYPEHGSWSSYMATAGAGKAAECLTTDWVLGQFSRNKIDGSMQYAEFVYDGISSKTESPWQRLKGRIFFGSSWFIAKMQDKLVEKKDIKEIPREQRYPGRPSLQELFTESNNRQGRDRQIATAHLEYGYTLQQIASALGIHYTTVSRAVKRQREKLYRKT